MKVIRKVAKSNWDFILYETDQGYVLNVVFPSGIVDYSRSFRITEKEAKFNIDQLKELAQCIRDSYGCYKSQEIKPTVRPTYPA